MLSFVMLCLLTQPVPPAQKVAGKPASSQIVNTASAQYEDRSGKTFQSESNTVRTEVKVTVALHVVK
jgi:hypothetical protein